MDEGQADDFAVLFRRCAPQVFGYVRRRADRAMAEDVVADTFLAVWRLRGDIPDDPVPWLFVIARNALANRQRSLRRTARLHAALAGAERVAAQTPGAEDVVIDRATVLNAVAELSPAEREAVLLVAWDGLTQQQAARVAGCSPGTLSRRLGRARRRLSHAMKAQPARGAELSGAHPVEEPS